MLKQFMVLLILSTLIVFSMSYAQQVVQSLITAHDWVSQLLTDVFTVGQVGNLARGLIALLAIPLAAALIPALFYWIVRKHWFPYFIEIIWAVWLVQAGALLMTRVA